MRLLNGLPLAIFIAGLSAQATTITFEGLPPSDFGVYGLDNKTLQGVTFYDFEAASTSQPGIIAHSGVNVALESYGDFPPRIVFNSPVTFVSGYFNYGGWDISPLCLFASDAAGQPVAQACSKYPSNIDGGPWPYAPNEYIALSSNAPITSVYFQYGDDSGYYFTVDDLTFASTPEPATWLLVALSICFLSFHVFLKRRARTRLLNRT